ncbi:transcriptional regulator [Anoxybacterium hadale]|uniref:Transcriptional regulator n=1 Tax=Anoxybacterium hadale TaxID=3408580 RepID=A0ACD1AAM6_9FIRM|nr:transcriptional regulator [Clostridiales bacterium]
METSVELHRNQELEIQMLGDFCLRYGDQILSGDRIRGKQVWSLLEYIMVNRHNEISMDGQIQVLWEDDEVDDPANALKNLAYRLRVALRNSLGLKDMDTIVFKHGAYAWNKSFLCIVDADLLEESYKALQQNSLDLVTQKMHLEKIIRLYKGGFMPQSAYKEWILPQAVYYQRIYMEAVQRYSTILLDEGDCSAVEELCRRAISIDPFVETNHALLIQALIQSKNHGKAIEHYNYVNKLYYDELGVRPSDQITKLYHMAVDKGDASAQDISMIKDDLKEVADINGAIYCNYEEFKMIYQLEARASLRSGKSIFIALLTVTGKDRKSLPKNNLDTTFEKLKNSIVYALRKDDVVARYGRTQFLLMLSNLTYENSNMVLDRLVKKINCSGIDDAVEVYGQLQTLEPIELEEQYVSV